MRLQLNNTYIILAIIILGILLLWFFQGTKEGYDNYTNDSNIYTDTSGNTATVTSDSINASGNNGSGTILKVTNDPNVYADSLGNTAFITESSTGVKTLTIKNDQGDVKIYTNHENKSKQTYDNYNHYDKTSYPLIYYGPNGNTARVIKTPNDNSLVITNNDGSTHIYYIDKYDKNVYKGDNGAKATIIITSNGKKAIEINDGKGNIIVFYQDKNYYKTNNNNNFVPLRSKLDFGSYFGGSENEEGGTFEMSTLPKGIPKWMIPKGEEDLYVLKSQIVPPVCPLPPPCPKQKNNSSNNNSNNNGSGSGSGSDSNLDDTFDVTKCPACPPCARCQEPAFTCEKVPNYSAFSANGGALPAYDDWASFR